MVIVVTEWWLVYTLAQTTHQREIELPQSSAILLYKKYGICKGHSYVLPR